MSFPGLKNHGLEVLPSPSPLFTAEVDYTTHTPLDSRHFKLLHDHILAWIPRAWMSIFGLDTEGMNEYIWLGYWGHEWVYLACITLDTTILQQASSLPFKVEGTFLLDVLPVILAMNILAASSPPKHWPLTWSPVATPTSSYSLLWSHLSVCYHPSKTRWEINQYSWLA